VQTKTLSSIKIDKDTGKNILSALQRTPTKSPASSTASPTPARRRSPSSKFYFDAKQDYTPNVCGGKTLDGYQLGDYLAGCDGVYFVG
jgi:hypothetical protein